VIHFLCGDPASSLIMGSHQLPLPFGTPMVMMMILVRDGLPLLEPYIQIKSEKNGYHHQENENLYPF